MRKLCMLAFLAACDIGEPAPDGDEHGDDKLPEITGTISADMTIMGSKRFEGTTVIAPNVTVTVKPGAELVFAEGAAIVVEGALAIEGTQQEKIIGRPAEGATLWGPIAVYGSLYLTYVDFNGGAITTNGPEAQAVINDSKMFRTDHDYIVMNGGKLDMKYSQLGPNPGETDTTHCQLHINAAVQVSVLRSNIASAPFGFMFYGGVGLNLQLNNWYGNMIDIDTMPGVEGNFSGSWFEKGAPTPGPGAMFILDNLATARIEQAGPRL